MRNDRIALPQNMADSLKSLEFFSFYLETLPVSMSESVGYEAFSYKNAVAAFGADCTVPGSGISEVGRITSRPFFLRRILIRSLPSQHCKIPAVLENGTTGTDTLYHSRNTTKR